MGLLLLTALFVGAGVVMFRASQRVRRSLDGASATALRPPSSSLPADDGTINVRVGEWVALPLPSAALGLSGVVHVPSESTLGASYAVDLGALTCTCPDFAKRREAVDRRLFARLCKHLVRAIDGNAAGASDDLWRALVTDPPRPGASPWLVALPSRAIIVAVREAEGWIGVYARSRAGGDKGGGYSGPYRRFGWNIDQSRWSYGKNPPGAVEIKRALATLP